jgi:hypothetical protein
MTMDCHEDMLLRDRSKKTIDTGHGENILSVLICVLGIGEKG